MASLEGDLLPSDDRSLDRILDDACTVLGLDPPVGAPSSSPEEFFVGEIDVTEATHPHLGASQATTMLQLDDDLHGHPLSLAPDADAPELLLGTSAPATLHSASWPSFPTIPEHSELQINSANAPTFPSSAPSRSTFIPTAATTGIPPDAHLTAVELEHTTTTTGGGRVRGIAQAGGGGGAGVPRVASMPNLSLGGGNGNGGGASASLHMTAVRRSAAQAAAAAAANGNGNGNHAPSLRHHATGMSRSRSANDVTSMSRYAVPHSEFLTPPHLRKGKGGRQPAGDPRLDPRIDPKKAKRILANRLSAAKSKLKQKSAAEGLKQRVEMLRLQREGLATEVSTLEDLCSQKEAEREGLLRQLRMAEESVMRGKGVTGLFAATPTVNSNANSVGGALMV